MAADRIVNVPINFDFRAPLLEKLEQNLKRADQATEKLRQSTQTFTNTSSRGYQSTSKYIEGMEIELARLRQQIKLTSTADTQRLTQLSSQYKALKSQVDAYNKALFETSKTSKQAAADTKQLASQINSVYQTAKLLITAGVAREIVNISLEAAKLAGNIEGVDRAFQRQIPNSIGTLQRLRDATHGTVTDLELMQRALQAKNFGIDVQRLPELLEFAAVRAQQTGQSVDYLVNSIVMGIGRKSLLILDNLGLSATRLKEEFNGASLASRTVAEVTQGVANIAKVEMGKMGGYVETAATEVDQLKVAWEELRAEMAKGITSGPAGGATGFFKGYVDSFKALVESWNKGIPVAELFTERMRLQLAQISANEFVQRRFTDNREENAKILEEEIRLLTKSVGAWGNFKNSQESIIKDLEDDLNGLERRQLTELLPIDAVNEMKRIKEEIELRKRLIEVKKEDTLIDQEILKLLQARLVELKKLSDDVQETPGLIESVEEKIKNLQEAIKKATSEGDIRRLNHELSILEVTLKRLQGLGESDKLFENIEDAKSMVPGTKADSKISPLIKRNNANLVDVQKQLDEAAEQLFLVLPVEVKPMPYSDSDFQKAWDDLKDEVYNSSLDSLGNLIMSEYQLEVDGYSARINALRNFYDEQQLLAGDNDRAKKDLRLQEEREIQELEKKRADREKKAALAGIRVSTALGIIKVFAGEGTFADKLIKSAIVALEGATQYAYANRTRYYAKGEIDIKGGRQGKDSIPSMLMPGESVMTKEETQASKGVLKAIRAKKLNDRILKEITSGRSGGSVSQRFDDSKIIKELREIKNATPDIERRGNLIYEARKRGEQYRQWIRKQSM